MALVQPRYAETNLTHHVRTAAQESAVSLPTGLALVYWDKHGECRAFSLHENNLHFAVPSLRGVYKHASEIIPA